MKGRHSMEERFRSISNLLGRRSFTTDRSEDSTKKAIEETPIHEGWLSKESRNVLSMTKWQKRYFVLYETKLMYWSSEADCRSGQTSHGMIDLTGCSVAVFDEAKRPYTFGIHHPQRRDYLLEAQNKREFTVWVKTVEEAIVGRERRVPSLIDFELLKVIGRGASGVVLQVSYVFP